MKRFIGYILSALLLIGGAQAVAQSVVWTGDYYVVVGMNEKAQYAITYGFPPKWQGIKAGPNLDGGIFADLAVAPTTAIEDERVPGRFQLMAVGAKDAQAYTVTGYEWANEPLFEENIEPLANLMSATAASWAGSYYVVLGKAMGGDGALPTPRDAVAFGHPGAWEVAYLPFNDDLTFMDLAVGAMRDPSFAPVPYEMLAIGTRRDGSAFAMLGYEENGWPLFSGNPIPIPEITKPVDVEWTGHDFIITGQNDFGDTIVLHGFSDQWERAKDIILDGGVFTSLAVAATDAGHDLLAVGTLKDRAVSVAGIHVDGVPIFEHNCVLIPDLYALGDNHINAISGDIVVNALGAPYPNPFNPQASFDVTVANDQDVRIEVFNVLGQRVAIIHEGLLTNGQSHTFTFDGATIPSGTYILRAQGENFTETRQLNLLK